MSKCTREWFAKSRPLFFALLGNIWYISIRKILRPAENRGEQMTQELLSIVTPVYNAENYILETIQMVLNQTYQNWELLLINDASTDNSAQVIADYLEQNPDSRIRLFQQEKNQGAAAARNRGIAEARGRYLAYLDADDIWFTEKMEKELSFMSEKQAAFVCCSYEFGDENAKGTGRIVHVLPELTYKKALSRTIIFTTTVVFDLTKLTKEQIRMPLVKSEDTASWWSILRQGYTAYGLDEVLAIYRRPRKSLSSNKLEAMKRIWNLYRKQEHLGIFSSAWYFCFWAWRATMRRI